MSSKDAASLDYSRKTTRVKQHQSINAVDLMTGPSEMDADETSAKSSGWGIGSYFKSLVSGKLLEASDVEEPLEAMRQAFISKNVAVEVAAKLIDSVKLKLPN